MPPLKNIDRGINGEMLKALEEIGHGAQIAVVDASYDIPRGAQVVNYHGTSSCQALKGILDLVPVDQNDRYALGEVGTILAMLPDPPDTTCEALEEFQQLLPMGEYDSILVGATRNGDSTAKGRTKLGFYASANDPERHTLFVRTRDEKAYACALFIVGHSQH